MAALIALAVLGCVMVRLGRDDSPVQTAGAVLALTAVLSIPMGHLLGLWS